MNPSSTKKEVTAIDIKTQKLVRIIYEESLVYHPQINDICVMLHGAEMPVVFKVTEKDLLNIRWAPKSYRKADYV